MISQVQVCKCIWKCGVFAGKQELKGQSRIKFKEANEESRLYSSARWIHFQRWQGPGATPKIPEDQGVMIGLHVRRPPILIARGWSKMIQMKGHKSKMSRWATLRKMGPNRPRKGPGRLAWSDQPNPFFVPVRPPLWPSPSSVYFKLRFLAAAIHALEPLKEGDTLKQAAVSLWRYLRDGIGHP
jgi:hypothetical protein